MKSLTLKEAASFLKMHSETLREKAKGGHVPGRKVGKAWVFIEEHLADFVSGNYHQPREGLRLLDGGKTKEFKKCQSTDAKTVTVKSGTLISEHQMASEYANLLGLKTNVKPKSYTTNLKRTTGVSKK